VLKIQNGDLKLQKSDREQARRQRRKKKSSYWKSANTGRTRKNMLEKENLQKSEVKELHHQYCNRIHLLNRASDGFMLQNK
jgi:hypothetical protein